MDLQLIETGNGGDNLKNGNDLALIYGWENMPYIAMFGHRGGVTKTSYSNNEFRGDWWGNSLLHPQDPAVQINSLTEDALHNTPLTSAGRLLIEEAIKADLAFMQPFAEVTVTTAITGVDKFRIDLLVKKPDNLEQKQYIFIWDATLQELTQAGITYSAPPNLKQLPTAVADTAFEHTLQLTLNG